MSIGGHFFKNYRSELRVAAQPRARRISGRAQSPVPGGTAAGLNKTPTTMSNELTIIKRENVELIASNAPQAYTENQVSRQRCLAAGQSIIDAITANGMTDDLDLQAATYIERARKTVRKMYDKRSPVTKIFDEIRTQFTSMEAAIDPTKRDSIPYRLQQLRNEYARKKRDEEERRRRAAIIEQQRQAAVTKYRGDVEWEYTARFNTYHNNALNTLNAIFSAITLDNILEQEKKINGFPTTLPDGFLTVANCTVQLPPNVAADELRTIRQKVLDTLLPRFSEQFDSSLTDRKLELVQILPSKRQELERAAKATADEAERIRKDMEMKEAAMAARRQQELAAAQSLAAQEAKLQQQKTEVNDLFAATAVATPTYQPKTSVKKHLTLLNPEGIMPVLSLWWKEEGCHLTVAELSKMFKKQITFCDKLANSATPQLIEDESVYYEEEVKAK